MVTTNLEMGIKTTMRGKVEKEGSFTADAKVLAEHVSLLPKETVEIFLEEDDFCLKTQKTQTRIKGLPADEFPLLPEVNKEKPVVVDSGEFKKAVTQAIFAVSHDETRMELSGIYFKFEKEGLTLAATDSFRLAERKLATKKEKEGENVEIIVPAKSVMEMGRVMGEEGEAELFFSEGQIAMHSAQTEFVSRTIEGRYPDYHQIIPKERNTRVHVNRAELVKSLKGASLFCKPGINDVSLAFSPAENEIVITAINSQVGENISRLEADISGQENKGVFNYKYFLDGLNSFATDEVTIDMIDQTNPALITPKGQEGHLYLIMPIRQ